MALARCRGMLRCLWAAATICGCFLLERVARATQPADLGLPIVAADSQLSVVRAAEAPAVPNDDRWRSKPFNLAVSAILGLPQGADPFLMTGAEFAYAFPSVTLGATIGATVGELDGLNATLALRGRLHLGHAVALTLGPRGALLPLEKACGLSFGEDNDCKQTQRWGRAFLAGGDLGVEGRTEAGFMWRAQAGLWGLLAHGEGSCTPVGSAPSCSVTNPQPGVVATEEVTLGWAF